MDRVREAALARAQAAPKPVVEPNQVKDAVKAFNAAVLKVPDYRHIHCSQILDAVQILDKILKDLVAFGGKSPKDPSKKVRAPHSATDCGDRSLFTVLVNKTGVCKPVCLHVACLTRVVLDHAVTHGT